jgi:hypothetical protein
VPHRLRTGTPARLTAFVWWVIVVFVTAVILGFWILAVKDPTLLRFSIAALVMVGIGWPIRHEWPHARRMGAMLVTGR